MCQHISSLQGLCSRYDHASVEGLPLIYPAVCLTPRVSLFDKYVGVFIFAALNCPFSQLAVQGY